MQFEDKGKDIKNDRQPSHPVDALFTNRWSPRAFDPRPISEEALKSIFEAARWSMSCFNEQPWLIIYATDGNDLDTYLGALAEGNRKWARNAPVLGFIFARRRFTRNDKPNRWAEFDTGAAWMAFTLQARMLGLYTHGMGGFDRDKAYEITAVPRDVYTVIAAFALGRYGDRDSLNEDKKKNEQPNNRKPLSTMIARGKFKGNSD